MKTEATTATAQVVKGLLMVIAAPIVMIGLILAVFPCAVVGIVNMIRDHGKTPKITTEAAADMMQEPQFVPRMAG